MSLFRVQDLIDIKIGEYKVILAINGVWVMVYWTHDGEKQCRIVKHPNPNFIGDVYTLSIKKEDFSIIYIDMDEKTLRYWRQFVKLCDQ